ncbi:bifunctional acetate--CoA ligase family protein/GNAT family N-acetyltransferase [Ilumatobacter coccineus]|uniref:Putative acetyltransferase n=1 Tax=Ilumatobacter coccineus (strain NBRC 103263 / KCTC 29153 / YM16-304) TaxID=1313172 RepID=A0A6C7EAV0_ILUCY|nr:GNAT family N-acetyltransferase [Ilumatobacter coccineus]BAN03132.1 putative acetyltransferase [Ilumatobacter coccineus YM16-304]
MSSEATTSRWATSVVLGDGESAYIRPLVPEDQDALLAFHERQSPESLYRRFFSPKPSLTRAELEHFTTVDMVDRVALAVELHDELVAWASYERWTGRNEAEAAFMVDDAHHGRGIATLLLEHLAAIARTNGITRFTAEVLADNRGMLAVFAKAGWPLERRFDSGVVDLDWELATTDEFLDSVERREQRADSRAVARVLLPRAIAMVGASDRVDTIGHQLWTHLRDSAAVPVYPVNPRLEDLDGRRCYGSVDDLPDDVSLAIIAVPPKSLESTIDACIAKRMRGAVIVTIINGPKGPQIDIASIVARARRNGLRIIGPNSMGVASLHAGSALQASLVDVSLPPGRVAISMQSGTLGASLLRRARDLDLGLSWFVSLGDKSDVSANDLLQFWEDDDNTKVIGLYTETFGNPRKFARIARRAGRKRPIVAVRTGAAADGPMGSALYQQAGLIEVPSVHALLDAARVLAYQPTMRGPSVAVLTNSVSPGTLAMAALRAAGMSPVESTAGLDWQSSTDEYGDAMSSALDDPEIDAVFVIYAPSIPAHESLMSKTITDAARGASKPVVAVMIGSTDGPIAPDSEVPGFAFPEAAAAALGASFAYGGWLATEADTTITHRPVDPARAKALISQALDAAEGNEIELGVGPAIQLLSTYGIAVAGAEETPAARATDVAERLGYPVAVKAVHRQPGRSARSGIALDLNNADDVTDAIAVMNESLGNAADRFVVQRMTSPGITVRIKCTHDDRLGAIVSVGYGGVDADVIGDRSDRLAPISPSSAAAMLTETLVGQALADAGFDPSPLVDTIVQSSQLCADHADIDVLDLNPVIVSAGSAIVTDLTVRLVDRPDDDGPIRRLG